MTVPQAVRTMAVPAVMSQIIVLIYNLADTFFIGRTNNPYMVAGVSLILPLFNVCLAIGSMFGSPENRGRKGHVSQPTVFVLACSPQLDFRF